MRLRPFLLLAPVWLWAASARAETSAWLAASGGTSILTVNESEVKVRGSMAFDVGVGSSPDADLLFGGFVRVAPIFSEGTDMAFLARGATQGFQSGYFGVAIDLGGYLRLFDPADPQGGFLGEVVLGGPLGLQLTLAGHAGTMKSYGGAALLGLDLLRLTVYRQHLTEWWTNPLSPSARASER
mgnify:CR=1 FL=1